MSIYRELFDLRPFINAGGHLTGYGGSLMTEETLAAMNRAAAEWVDIRDLLRLASTGIAEMLGITSALGGVHITSGAAAANALAAAAVMTGNDRSRMEALPDSSGFPNEILMQPAHAIGWARSYAAAGARITVAPADIAVNPASGPDVLGGAEDSFESGINENTCAIAAILSYPTAHTGTLPISRLVAIARRHRLPVIVDAAAQIPPISTVAEFLKMGVSLVAVSGGKALCGPNDTGLLAGSHDFLTPAILQSNPNTGVVGRAYKVSKEQIVGLYIAMRAYVNGDPDGRVAENQQRCNFLVEQLAGIDHIRLEKLFPDELGRPVPTVRIHLLEPLGRSAGEIIQILGEESPSIRVRRSLDQAPFFGIFVSTLRVGEIEIVAKRLTEVLTRTVSRDQPSG